MDPVNAFEQQLSRVATEVAGPVRPVDAMEVVRSAKAAPVHRWPIHVRGFRGGVTTRMEGSFSMFSALKFVAAGAIVALFGGFLLTGILTTPQGDDVLPAAVTESPSPMTSEELLSGMVTEEVEPGVFRVVNDGVRDLAKASNSDIVAGEDDGIWVLRSQRFFRLGGDELREWATKEPDVSDFEVAPDGTVWTIQTLKKDTSAIQSFDGEEWTIHHEATDGQLLEVTPEGTVWAMRGELHQETFGYIDEGGWQALGDLPRANQLLVASPADIWAIGWEENIFSRYLYRFIDGAWQRWVTMEGIEPTWQPAEDPLAKDAEWFDGVGVGSDGTFWGVAKSMAHGPGLVRFDGSEWSRWSARDEGTFWPAGEGADAGFGGYSALGAAPDGSVWVALMSSSDPYECDGGVGRFDGETWGRHLSGLCVEAIDITADGSVWLLAKEPGADLHHVHVITPEAVARAE